MRWESFNLASNIHERHDGESNSVSWFLLLANPALKADLRKLRLLGPLTQRYAPLACAMRFSRSSKIRFMSPANRSAWHDVHTLFMSRPIRSLSGTVAGFSPQISHIFFPMFSLRLLHNCAFNPDASPSAQLRLRRR